MPVGRRTVKKQLLLFDSSAAQEQSGLTGGENARRAIHKIYPTADGTLDNQDRIHMQGLFRVNV